MTPWVRSPEPSGFWPTLDLKGGYWHVTLHPDGKEKTVFSTSHGLRQFTVMYLGLCNAPATFKWLMEFILCCFTYEACLVYVEDVIFVGRVLQEQLDNLWKVFQMF
jgi:hypothetical protein